MHIYNIYKIYVIVSSGQRGFELDLFDITQLIFLVPHCTHLRDITTLEICKFIYFTPNVFVVKKFLRVKMF